MLQNWFIMLPELLLLSYLPLAWLVKVCRSGQTYKTFYTLSKYFLSAALVFNIIFYNKTVFASLLLNTAAASLFKTIVYLAALVWFYLSSKWFLNKSRSSFVFYQLAVSGVLILELLISSHNLMLTAILLTLGCLLVWAMLNLHWDKNAIKEISVLYAFFAVIFLIALWIGIIMLAYHRFPMDYAAVRDCINDKTLDEGWLYVVMGLTLAPVLFMLGLAPFHSCLVGVIRSSILPVSGYLTLVFPVSLLCVLLNLVSQVWSNALAVVSPLLLAFAVISLVLGALSANGEKNLRQLFAFSSIYHLGFMLFTLVSFNANSLLSAFTYIVIYLLSMLGIYTVFLGLKSRGNYLTDVDDIDGLSLSKPYISVSWLIFMVSLIGLPPMLGFLGRLSVINNLVLEERWGSVICLLLSLLFIANAYLQLIRHIYFTPVVKSFDRADKAIYLCLFVNLLLVLISTLNPEFWLRSAEHILKGAV